MILSVNNNIKIFPFNQYNDNTISRCGNKDRTIHYNDDLPDGNPYQIMGKVPDNIVSCHNDDQNDLEIDGDELNTYHGRFRNDPIRATIGTMNRKKDLDQYLREEVDEEEDRMWWGRHEL
jgi:hypothetical protein